MISDRNKRAGEPTEALVSIDAWVAANHPPLGSTREKVLSLVAALSRQQAEVTSQQLRLDLGLSQQLLNRHLHGLAREGLLRLVENGPGRPLGVTPTALGLRVAQRLASLPAAEAQPNAAPEMAPPPVQSPDPTAPPARILEARGLLGSFLGSLLARLDGRTSGVGPAELRRAVEDTLHHLIPRETPAPPAVAQPARVMAPSPAVAEASPPQAMAQPAPAVTPPPAVATSLGQCVGAYCPPRLSPEEAYEEGRLDASCAAQYRGMPWYERTKGFSDVWDRLRRGRTGSLSTFFNGFGPRWEHPNWPDFNKARQMADAAGQDYGQWLARRMDAMTQSGLRDCAPHLLAASPVHQPAAAAPAPSAAPASLENAPYAIDAYNSANPEHVAHAQKLLAGLLQMAPLVFGADPDGPARMVTEALIRKQLPRQALDLAPEIKARILERHRKGARNSGWSTSASDAPPPIII